MNHNRIRSTLSILAVSASLAVLGGCASNQPHKNGEPAPFQLNKKIRESISGDKIKQTHLTSLNLKLNVPDHIFMQKQAIGEIPVITAADKQEALLTAKAQIKVIEEGMRSKFEKKAMQYGVTTTEMSGDILSVDVVSVYSFCESDKGCKTRLNLQVKITDVTGKDTWRYDGGVEQMAPKDGINPGLFDEFADTLLEAMKKDGVVGKF